MKFVIAPDKYKDSLSGFEFCDAVEEGLQRVFQNAEIIKKPLADGGDGTIAIIGHYLNGNTQRVEVNDPLFRKIEGSYLYNEASETAFVEMAEASGLKLLNQEERNCMYTTTYGTGELIVNAIQKGASKIILGIGGSATCDAGMGMAHALGYDFLDAQGNVLSPIGANLIHVAHINDSRVLPELHDITFLVACDVTNPLYGSNGSAHVYGSQKGASEAEVLALDKGLRNYASIVNTLVNNHVQEIEGGGAAGGMGVASCVFLKATLTSGIDLIKELAGFEEAVQEADWIITGEGQLDEQTISGKTISGVLETAKKHKIPVAALCGSIDISIQDQEDLGLTYATAITSGVMTLQKAIAHSYENLVMASYNFARALKS
ncbi:glycerate kinase [uncultured Dokdonia sp.]|uniref:glycerate kinase n=1 Tax=uncultured Dokdonia sp. TaxID=575653 RepID=UPI00261B4926|nr:glycerate kinase [uncultured Dokdonia sp.]